MKYYLAIDIGASSGRHMLGHMESGKMVMEEIYRFENGLVERGGHLCWDVNKLFAEILFGMKKCKELGKVPESVGIDTWAVDFVLLDENNVMIGDSVGYRDSRTDGMDAYVYQKISESGLYTRTGIQKQMFNTIYQLMAIKQQHPEQLEQAKSMLLIPDYFHFLLTGVKVCEYTNATTTQLINPKTYNWEDLIIDMLGYPREIFMPIAKPGTDLGLLREEIANEIGYQTHVVLPATHDTGSAVMAVPTNEQDTLYISSGTWSLMGIERMQADCSMKSREKNFTNEGGYNYRFRFLKNIMGLWMIQSIRREIAADKSFGEICEEASKSTIPSIIDANDARFLAPKNMTEEVKAACAESGQQVPETLADIAAVVYNSLAVCYDKTAKEIEEITGKHFDTIHIIGGGANAVYLNELTAHYTGKRVLAGPTEATAIGNLLAQMLAAGEFSDLREARSCVYESFGIKEYE